MLVLRSSPASPFGRKVRIAAALLGLEKRIEVVAADTNDPADVLRRQNPLGKVPVLIDESGEAIFDSRVIVEYLDGLAGGGRLIPAEFALRIQALTLPGARRRDFRRGRAADLRAPVSRAGRTIGQVAGTSGRESGARAGGAGSASACMWRAPCRNDRARLRARLPRSALCRRLASGTPSARRLARRVRRRRSRLRRDRRARLRSVAAAKTKKARRVSPPGFRLHGSTV